MNNKTVMQSYTVSQKHWVGDGFYVHGLIRPSKELLPYISPFILMDYGSPHHFDSTKHKRGVGEHPHRGFETVTLAYQGEVEHRDSAGGGGVIKPGDVQWMTAGKGVVHDEFHSADFSKQGGIFEMVQLWVNLPASFKMSQPKYQGIKSEIIPKLKVGKTGTIRIIAGEIEDLKGPAKTFTEINMFDIYSEGAEKFQIYLKEKTNTILLILAGKVKIEDVYFNPQEVVIFHQEGEELSFECSNDFKALLLNGVPINEPVFAHGPFVMNSREEIIQAITDYQDGKMGSLN